MNFLLRPLATPVGARGAWVTGDVQAILTQRITR